MVNKVRPPYIPGYWDDLKFPVTQTKVGSNSLPHFDYTNLGLLFPQNDTGEKIYIIGQFPHNRENGSNIRPHIHYVQGQAEQPTFVMEYKWYKNGQQVPASRTTITTAQGSKGIFTYNPIGEDILQIASFPEVDGSNIDTVSSIIDVIIYREDNDATGDILVKEFDIHYIIDTPGTRTEFNK